MTRIITVALMFIQGHLDHKPTHYVPCILLPGEYICSQDTLAVQDTAKFNDPYFRRHQRAGRASFIPVN